MHRKIFVASENAGMVLQQQAFSIEFEILSLIIRIIMAISFPIIATSHERHDVSNHQQCDCVSTSFARLTSKKTSQPRVTVSLWGESVSGLWLPSQGAGDSSAPALDGFFHWYDLMSSYGSAVYVLLKFVTFEIGWNIFCFDSNWIFGTKIQLAH